MAHVADITKLASLVEKLNDFDLEKTSIIFLRGGNIGVDNKPEYQKKRRNDVYRALLSTGRIPKLETQAQAAQDGAFGASFHLNMKTGSVDEVFHGIGFFNFSSQYSLHSISFMTEGMQ